MTGSGGSTCLSVSDDFCADERVTWTREQDEAVTFLYARRVLENWSRDGRVLMCRRFLLRAKYAVDPAHCPDGKRAWTALSRLLARDGDVLHADAATAGVMSLQAFCKWHAPAWLKEGPVPDPSRPVVFPLGSTGRQPVYRLQTSETACSLHAAIVVAYYAICTARDRADAAATTTPPPLDCPAMLDMTAFVRQTWDVVDVRKYLSCDTLWSAKRGSCDSIHVLRQLTTAHAVCDRDIGAWIEDFGLAPAEERVVEKLVRHGPALVSLRRGWRRLTARDPAWPSFRDVAGPVHARTETGTHDDNDVKEEKGGHAMAVIGWRTDPRDGRLVLLIQNWWRHCPFFETDLTFLAGCSCRMAWVTTAPTSWPPGFPVVNACVAENDLDVCDEECVVSDGE